MTTQHEQSSAEDARALLDWYQQAARPFLIEFSGSEVNAYDDEVRRLRAILSESTEAVVCFVGPSGIGKSTLLNAIVAQEKTIAPSGGVGPLTALATEVRYSDVPTLRVDYHSKTHLWRLASALHFQAARERKLQSSDFATEAGLRLDDSEREELEGEIEATADPENEGAGKRMEEMLRTARLMVAGSQHEHRGVDYLADALSIACSAKTRWGAALSGEDATRVDLIRQALQMSEKGKPLVLEQAADTKSFRDRLRDHAAGFLSPLIRRMEVGWPSSALRKGLALVDLPGVGVAGDLYKKETQQYVRNKARAIVLVVDRAGPTDAVMDLLRTTGYWDRLVLSSDELNADPCSLVFAVTRVDDVATEEWYGIDPDEEGRRAQTKSQVFEQTRVKLREGMRKQFEQQLVGFTHTESSDAIREAREAAGRHLLETLQFHPVSAIEFRRILANNDDDPPFLKTVEQTGIPQLSGWLQGLAEAQLRKREERLELAMGRLAGSLTDQLTAIESSWRSSRAAAEAERVRAALQVILDQSNREFETRRVSFSTFLDQTVPEKIKVAVLEAKDEARQSVNKYLRSLRNAHWATLRAAVQRGGTYFGSRHINLPSDIALRFQDPVAGVWSQSLLKEIRKETYRLASDTRQLVDSMCDWAVQEEAAFVDEKVIETQKKLASAQVERLREVGKEAVEELRDTVRLRVFEAIEPPIQKACKSFVEEGSHVGRGVKERILTLFEDLASSATDAASRPTERTLLANYESVNADVGKALQEWGNPLESTADAIVARHESRIERSDAQRRNRILAALEQVRSDAPEYLRESNREVAAGG